MTLMKRIHSGRRHTPPRLLIYGTEGIDKSTTAAQAPNPIFIPTEDGLDQIDCVSFPLAGKLADVESALQSLLHEKHDLNALRSKRGMCVILLAHAKVEKFEDPEHSSYDRYSPRLHKHATALITEWADAVLFATRKIITKTEDGGFGRDRTIAAGLGKDGGERVLRTVGSPACVAKNRYDLPAELPLSWPALMQAMTQDSTTANSKES